MKTKRQPWIKTASTLELSDGMLVYVDRWQRSKDNQTVIREEVFPCGSRVFYDGRTMSSSIVRYFLQTGEWVRRVPKPRKYRAVVRDGKKTVHLGYFSTIEERNAAVFAYRIGVAKTC